jgi:glutaredoxin 3
VGSRRRRLDLPGDIHVGGCDELYALDREGKLDSLLAGEKVST